MTLCKHKAPHIVPDEAAKFFAPCTPRRRVLQSRLGTAAHRPDHHRNRGAWSSLQFGARRAPASSAAFGGCTNNKCSCEHRSRANMKGARVEPELSRGRMKFETRSAYRRRAGTNDMD